MNQVTLPPKRFQKPHDPKYDSIRHYPWFHKLARRRAQITMLEQAHKDFKDGKLTQLEVAAAWGIDARELRDYIFFVEGGKKLVASSDQHVLDFAYSSYCDNPNHGIRYWIKVYANMGGFKSRPIIELWEVDPTFYPTGYIK